MIDSLRGVAGFVLIASGVLLVLVFGAGFLNAVIDWTTGADFRSGDGLMGSVHRNPGKDALLSLCGVICGVVFVKLARRVQIPRRLRELAKHLK